MSGPYFPVDLGDEALQSTPETEEPYRGPIFDTQRGGFDPHRGTHGPQPVPIAEGFGDYQDKP